MKNLISVKDIDVKNKKVLLRVDFNVPVVDGKVGDQLRIAAAVPTIEYLLTQNCALILISHLGRPDGKRDMQFSLKPIAKVLADLIKRPVKFADDCIGLDTENQAADLKAGQLLLLENLRFHSEEEANDPEFAKQLASLAEVYVDDAFAVIHRAHASLVSVPKLLPHAAGLLVIEEYETLTSLLEKPKQPFLAIIGGAKVSTKIEVLDSLLTKVDKLVVSGAMANTFLLAKGYDMAASAVEVDNIQDAKNILSNAKKRDVELILPVDLVVAAEPKAGIKNHIVSLDGLAGSDKALDVGPDSATQIEKLVEGAQTIFWNGPLGCTEVEEFAKASLSVARSIIKSQAESIIGGGDTASFIDAAGLHNKFSFVSTGGGASLDMIAGKKLPGIEALR